MVYIPQSDGVNYPQYGDKPNSSVNERPRWMPELPEGTRIEIIRNPTFDQTTYGTVDSCELVVELYDDERFIRKSRCYANEDDISDTVHLMINEYIFEKKEKAWVEQFLGVYR